MHAFNYHTAIIINVDPLVSLKKKLTYNFSFLNTFSRTISKRSWFLFFYTYTGGGGMFILVYRSRVCLIVTLFFSSNFSKIIG